jgi:hypothetical protein
LGQSCPHLYSDTFEIAASWEFIIAFGRVAVFIVVVVAAVTVVKNLELLLEDLHIC